MKGTVVYGTRAEMRRQSAAWLDLSRCVHKVTPIFHSFAHVHK